MNHKSVMTILAAAVFFCSAGVTITGKQAIVSYADSAGFSWQWERVFARLTCTRGSSNIRFYEDNAFCFVNGEARRLPEPPVYFKGTLYLSKSILDDVFRMSGYAEAASATRRDFSKGDYNILSATSEMKSNGTLLEIRVADSLPFDVTYFYPNLTFNFYGGKVDVGALRQHNRVGVIDSIFSTQFDVSAQITAIVTREIEEPMIDYIQDTKTLMVSIWPKKQARKVPNKTTIIQRVPSEKSKEATIVVIDPGHGGKDPGAIGPSGLQEKDVVLSIALKVRDALKKRNGIKVFMTREKDTFIPLGDRTEFANKKKAHLFISIHADAVGGSEKRKQSTRGYKIYFLSQAKNEDDKLAAMRENDVIKLEERPQKYTELQNVLIEMAGNEYLRESQELCILLEQTFSVMSGKKIAKLHKGIGQANFWVLNGAFMPSVLIETGFLSNKKEEKYLAEASFQDAMADAITDAVIRFCKRFESAGL